MKECIEQAKTFADLEAVFNILIYNASQNKRKKKTLDGTPMQTLLEGKSLWDEKIGQSN